MPSFEIETGLASRGLRVIAGVDEAGRGALAGPLCLGAVIYSPRLYRNTPAEFAACIDDSKRLSATQRREALDLVRRHAHAAVTVMVSHRTIDRLNINGATCFAIQKILALLPVRPDVLLLDGKFAFRFAVPVVSVVRGDQRSFSIASASIAAKLRRDEVLERFDRIYPGYDLLHNKGYGTLRHREAIMRMGPSAIHRTSYEPVRSMRAGQILFDHEYPR